MSSNECYARAMELQMMAHYEATMPSAHHSHHAPNPMAVTQPLLHSSADRQQYTFVSISPMRSSRAKALKPTSGYPSEPPLVCHEPTHLVNYPPHHRPSFPMIHGPSNHIEGMPPTPNVPSYFINASHTAQMNTVYFPPPNLPPQHLVHGNHSAQMNAYPLFPAPSLPEFITFDSYSSDLGAATAHHHGSINVSEPATTSKQRVRTASKWSDICFLEPKHQAKKEAKADISTPKPKKQAARKAKTASKQQAKKDAQADVCAQKSKKKTEKASNRRKGRTKPKKNAATKAKVAHKASKKHEKSQQLRDPSELDVLCGRGGNTNKHIGNMLFRDEASELKRAYQASDDNAEKRLLAEELVDRVQEYGSRFMKKGGDGKWHEMNDDEALKKAKSALRETKW